MSRPLRIEYPGAFYHVMNRGLNGNFIFIDEPRDRAIFKKTVGEAVDQWKIRIHAFSLMDNHYHFLVETPLANISRAMRHIDGVYTQRFNRIHTRDGPLLRGRFKSILIQRESYFLELVRYIHLNGVKAKVFPSPETDIYGSHWDYLHPSRATPWLEQSLVLSHFNSLLLDSRNAFHQFVSAGIPEGLGKILAQKKWPAILGGKSFIASITEQNLKSQKKNSELPQKNHLLKINALPSDLIFKLVFEGYASESKDENSDREIRWATMYFLRRYGFLNFKEIGRLMGGLSYKAVQKYLERNHFQTRPVVSLLDERFASGEMSHVAT